MFGKDMEESGHGLMVMILSQLLLGGTGGNHDKP
jgi:hypothetical protein